MSSYTTLRTSNPTLSRDQGGVNEVWPAGDSVTYQASLPAVRGPALKKRGQGILAGQSGSPTSSRMLDQSAGH
jgi:hypothetical protein